MTRNADSLRAIDSQSLVTMTRSADLSRANHLQPRVPMTMGADSFHVIGAQFLMTMSRSADPSHDSPPVPNSTNHLSLMLDAPWESNSQWWKLHWWSFVRHVGYITGSLDTS